MDKELSSISIDKSFEDYKVLIESLTKEQREVFDQICEEKPMPSVSISGDLEAMGLVAWSQLDIMSGFYEVASPEIYCVWLELKAIADQVLELQQEFPTLQQLKKNWERGGDRESGESIMICVSVTANHIKLAKPTPRQSPAALALIEMGYTDVSVTPHYAFIGDELYMLPEQAINSEKAFDSLIKNGASQDEILENIFPYQFEIEVVKTAIGSV